MGSGQGTTQETTAEAKICSLCVDRYQRRRQAVCTCNHCSLPLCSNCMNDHIDELPNSIAELRQQFHELEELCQTKIDMVQQEVSKSNAEVMQCLKMYQNGLLEAQQAILLGIENTRQDAEKYLKKINLELQTINADIETLAKDPIFQPTRMETLLNQFNQIQEKLETYKMTKDTELQMVTPKYILKFQCTPASTTNTTELSEIESSNLQDNSGKRSSHRNKYHPYKKNNRSHNGATDRN